MTTDNETNQQQVSIWSQLQLENQKINPATNEGNDAYLNRNLQLGNLDRETFKQLSLKADRALLFSSSRTNAIYVHNGLRSLSKIQFVNVLSGSKNGFVRTSLNTQTQRQELKDETKKGFGFGLFSRDKRR